MGLCECGCGEQANKRYIVGHNQCGKKRTPQAIEKMKMTLLDPEFNKKWREKQRAGWTTELKQVLRDANLGKTLSEEHRKKIGEGNKGKVRSQKERERLIEQLYNERIKLSKKGPTSIERKLYEHLSEIGIDFEKQRRIGGGFIVDAYIKSLNLIIEADGKYWHSTPRGIETDKRKNKHFEDNNYDFIRLLEDNINDGTFKKVLNKKLNQIKNGKRKMENVRKR